MARNIITEETKLKMNELYLEIGTYSGVAKIVGCAPSTVKKYIIPNFVSQNNLNIKRFKREDLPDFSTEIFKGLNNWGDLCVLSEKEKQDIKEFWNELVI